MTATNTTGNNPTLKKYFRYMLSNRQMSVQFSSSRIREIIENDLDIALEDPQSIYSKVCTEAFAFYMQSWPDWNTAINSTYSDEHYEQLRMYMRNKLLDLKNKERLYGAVEDSDVKVIEADRTIANQNCIDKEEYVMKIVLPNDLWHTKSISFHSFEDTGLVLQLEDTKPSTLCFSLSKLINHPFVHIEFKIPGLIHFLMSNLHKLDYIIFKQNKEPPLKKQEYVEKVCSNTTNSQVYTYELISALYSEIKAQMQSLASQIHLSKVREIDLIWDAFLKDIKESNLCDGTVCERASINYNVGKKRYFKDSIIEFNKNNINDNLVYRKILTPIANYFLKSCSIRQQDVKPDGFDFFKCETEDGKKLFQSMFVHYITASVNYKCLACNFVFDLPTLRKHLQEKHPIDSEMTCSECLQSIPIDDLLGQRWSHRCVPDLIPNDT